MTNPEPPFAGRAAPLAAALRQAAHAAAGGQQYPAGALYVVATPIGNLADLSLRAIEVLARADAVACEDRRVTGLLLRHLDLHKPLITAHQHQERAAAEAVIARLAAGERVALVSDAGTPALSDPGARLVGAVRAAGHRVVPIPGASAALAALSTAGPVGDGFRFVGFLPAQGAVRQAALAALAADPAAQVVYEAPHRIVALAAALADACGERDVTVARELTKQFEQVETVAAAALPGWLAADPDRRRGEFCLVVHPRPSPPDDSADPDLDATLRILTTELSLRQSAQLAARLHHVPRDRAYSRALALRDAEAHPPTDEGSAPDDDADAPADRQPDS